VAGNLFFNQVFSLLRFSEVAYTHALDSMVLNVPTLTFERTPFKIWVELSGSVAGNTFDLGIVGFDVNAGVTYATLEFTAIGFQLTPCEFGTLTAVATGVVEPAVTVTLSGSNDMHERIRVKTTQSILGYIAERGGFFSNQPYGSIVQGDAALYVESLNVIQVGDIILFGAKQYLIEDVVEKSSLTGQLNYVVGTLRHQEGKP